MLEKLLGRGQTETLITGNVPSIYQRPIGDVIKRRNIQGSDLFRKFVLLGLVVADNDGVEFVLRKNGEDTIVDLDSIEDLVKSDFFEIDSKGDTLLLLSMLKEVSPKLTLSEGNIQEQAKVTVIAASNAINCKMEAN